MPINYSKLIEVRDFRNGSWFWIQTHVWRDRRLTPADKTTYGTLASYANQEQSLFPSVRRIANESGLSERQIYRAIKNLEKYKYIKIERKRGGSNIYTLLKTTPDNMSPLTTSHTPPDYVAVPPDYVAVPPDYVADLTISNITTSNKQQLLNKRKSISALTEEDLIKISSDYNVPVSFTKSKLDDLVNYCDRTGRVYRDYFAALRNFVKTDAVKLRKEEDGRSKLRIITPDPAWENSS